MLHTTTKRLEICIDINLTFDKQIVIFASRIFRLALEITFIFNKYFFWQMVYEILSQSRKINKRWSK